MPRMPGIVSSFSLGSTLHLVVLVTLVSGALSRQIACFPSLAYGQQQQQQQQPSSISDPQFGNDIAPYVVCIYSNVGDMSDLRQDEVAAAAEGILAADTRDLRLLKRWQRPIRKDRNNIAFPTGSRLLPRLY